MNQPDSSAIVEELTSYTDEDATQIGKVLPHLSDTFDGQPIPESRLKAIIDSPSHAQLVARVNDEIVGIASLSLIMGAGSGYTVWLEDFVVSPEARGTGVADKLWDAMIDWCKQKQAKALNFTSRSSRVAAHRFYEKHGATIRDTSVFRKSLKS